MTHRRISGSWPACTRQVTAGVGTLILCMTSLPAVSPAVELTELDLETGGISPNGDGAFDTDLLTVTYTTADDSLDVHASLHQGGEERYVIVDQRIDAPDPFAFQWSGRDIIFATVPEGVYDLVVELTDLQGTAVDTIPIGVDTTPPDFRSVEISGPEGAYENGDYLQIDCRLDGPADSLWLDLSDVDTDTLHWATQIVQAHTDSTFGLLYRLSLDNTRQDGRNRPVPVFARDSLHNENESRDIVICLSNAPVALDYLALVTASGDEVPAGTPYVSGDALWVEARFQMPDSVLDNAAAAVSPTLDLSALDSEFDPFSNPAILESIEGTVLEPEQQISPLYVTLVTARFRYQLSEGNIRPEGIHDITLSATENGRCGTVEQAIPVTLGYLGPEAPVLDAVDPDVTATVLTLTGNAPGATTVEIQRDDGTPVSARAPVESDAFSVVATLSEGWNHLVAVAYDAFDRRSPASSEVSVFRATEVQLEVSARHRPGDIIRVSTTEAPGRVDVDIYNLSGGHIWHDTTQDPGEAHEFIWDGRNRSGDVVHTGPYVVRVTIDLGSRTEVLTKAIIFTRL